MYAIWRLLLLSLLALFCEGYSITLPSSSISVGEFKAFPWFWNATDFKLSPSGVFVVVLLNSTKEFDCPLQSSNPGLGFDTIPKIMEGSLVAKNPMNGTDSSGKFFFTPSRPGDHMICTYGNLSADALNQNPSKFNPNEFANILNSLQFIEQSEKFNVMQATQPTSTAMAPSANSTNTGDDDDNNGDDHRSDDHHLQNQQQTPIAAIVGGVVAGVALILLVFVAYIITRTVNKLQRGNQISLLSSTTPNTELAQPMSHIITPYNLDTMAAGTIPLTERKGRFSLTLRKLHWPRRSKKEKEKEKLEATSSPESQASCQLTPSLDLGGTRAQHSRARSPVTQHVAPSDSGRRPRSLAETSLVDAPPAYNEVR
ncbi:hypothetical protein L218DRAFT_1009130 [Marasmius fiardii PR-910]|nr:hypothetical protein L218DRAFT_1009130 [Marasmius fiardii PR-910]